MNTKPEDEKAKEVAEEAHGFWMEVGRTLDVWQRVEEKLCDIFVTIVQSSVDDVVRGAFYKVININTKRDMIKVALSIRVEDGELNSRWKNLSEKVGVQARKRNELAHGTRWDNNGRSVMGPHFSNITARERYMLS
ncbi:Hypothetical protein, partial CDS, partial [Neorhizobium galegae bv. orientalis]